MSVFRSQNACIFCLNIVLYNVNNNLNNDFKVVIDTANGATYKVAEKIFMGDPELKEEFTEKVERYNIANDTIVPQSKTTTRKFHFQRLNAAYHQVAGALMIYALRR